jgi:hypothetical protein
MEQPLTHCALCRKPAVLVNSHVIPAFVFRWKKETSMTGFMRFGENPRQRVQDGLKIPLLCASCEALLNEWETRFATNIFHPYNANDGLRADYGDWMLKFLVSVSWRVLHYFVHVIGLENWSDSQKAAAIAALERWRAFMLGEVPDPGEYQQHLLLVPAMSSTTVEGLPPNMNRYMARAVELDAPRTDDEAFVYSKMGRFAVFGVVVPPRNPWHGTHIPVGSGSVKPSEYLLPSEVIGYLSYRARRHAKLAAAIPDHQTEKIGAAILKDPERMVRSDQFAATKADIEMFGLDAVIRKPKAS